ncbi:MAG: VacJ family lipoprotein, partial [Gammaproteobacteria bacterium]|nr:VacJ family lipoprotein [Gammaproteobacteria bacterium]
MKKFFILLVALGVPVIGICGSTPAYTENITAENGSNFLILAAADSDADSKETIVAEDDFTDDELLFLDEDEEFLDVYDPLEPINRGIFWFNDKLYFYLLKPVAKGYRWVMPEPLMLGIGNFFSNLASPMRMINAGLQGKFGDAGNELTRFAVNTTIGIGGFFDTAKDHFNLKKKDEDSGQTLGYYGIGPGPYLVLPFFGPSSFRDGVGLLADSRMDLTYYLWEDRDYWAAIALRTVNTVALDKDTYEGIKRDALDPYLFIRDAWTQYRKHLVDN